MLPSLLVFLACSASPTGPGDGGALQDGGAEQDGGVPAFPGAQGYGAGATGWRDGSVYFVTRLDDNPEFPDPGSLRHALAQTFPRIIIFRTGGEIILKKGIAIKPEHSNVYVAGQTAPGGGITVRGGTLGIVSGAHDVLLRYVRWRKGSNNNITIVGGHDIMLDHLSASHVSDDNIETYRDRTHRDGSPISKLTVSRTIIGPGYGSSPRGGGQRGNHKPIGSGINDHLEVFNVDYHHSLFVHSHHRMPKQVNGGSKVVNNVSYNFLEKAMEAKGATTIDWIGNYIKKGPNSLAGLSRYIVHETVKGNSGESYPDGSVYVSGNAGYPDFESPPDDNWLLVYNTSGRQQLPRSRFQRTSPLPEARFPINVQTARQAYSSVLEDVGANRRLGCNGDWERNLDSLDSRVIADVRNGTGPDYLYDDAQSIGYPAVDVGSSCADQDEDGIPDAYERRFGMDPASALDAVADYDGDGYSNLEEYLNGASPN